VQRDERRRAIKELLEIVGLTKWRDAEVHTLSGGMRRRVEVARGLVHSPKILFLDEPTTGLDPVSRVDVWEMLEKIQGERQLTILLTTHYMEEADRLCDRIAIIDHGRLITLDTPGKLKASVPHSNEETSLNDVFAYYAGRGLTDAGADNKKDSARDLRVAKQ
jgi:ABC-2 type transport system ATP-binding protein